MRRRNDSPRYTDLLLRRYLLSLLYLAMAVAAALLAVRFVAGPFHFVVTVNSPVNAAGAVAVAFVIVALLRWGDPVVPGGAARLARIDLAIVAAVCAAAFLWNAPAPFVFDDYTHIMQASHATWRILGEAFRPERSGYGLFFRPVGFIWYWLDYQWAGDHAWRWHLWSMALHAVNACLVYRLVLALGLRRAAALTAALLFAVHGSRAETVAWADARFDLLATFWVLCALLGVVAYCRSGRRWWWLAMAASAGLAVCTKESAFCLPLLPLALLPCLARVQWRRAVEASVALGAVCAILFAYRWWALGGIGGYVDRTGARSVLESRPFHTIEALFFRQWGFLFFPVNWSVPLEWWLRVAAVGFLVVLVLFAAFMRGRLAVLVAGITFLVAASLPVQHLLMFQTDLAGARVHYLPVIGLAIFWGALVDGARGRWWGWAMAVALIGFCFAATAHNLRPWRETPAAAVAVCRELGEQMDGDSRPVFVSGLPDRRDGVYFLANGFPECVEMNSGVAASRVLGVDEATREARRFVWNPGAGRLVEVH